MTKEQNTTTHIRAVGRRKTAVARVQLRNGEPGITVNGKKMTEYFPITFWQEKVLAPLALTSKEGGVEISVKVVGGGTNAQAEAIRHGISRVLVKSDETLKPVLKAEGFLTRDSRGRERKKYGKHRARRGHQWRKR